jgi:Uma2 family endonuclease
MADPPKRRATYQDVLDAPEHVIAEIVDGELRLSPRPAIPHTGAASSLGFLLGPPFQFGDGGPGGWIICVEPELHLGEDVLVPDLAGWRTERLPTLPRDAFFTIAPDWVCEVLSPSTAAMDRAEKLPIYAANQIGHAWIVDPRQQTLDAMRLQDGKWLLVGVHRGHARARAEPFDAIEIDLGKLWAYTVPPSPRGSRASEGDFDAEL